MNTLARTRARVFWGVSNSVEDAPLAKLWSIPCYLDLLPVSRGSETPPGFSPSTPSSPAGSLDLCLYPHRPLPFQGPAGCSCGSHCWYWGLEMRGYGEHPGQRPRERASGPGTLPGRRTCSVLYPSGFCQSSNWQLVAPGAAAPDSSVFSRILSPECSFCPCCCCCRVAAASACTPPSQSQDCPPCCCPPSLQPT